MGKDDIVLRVATKADAKAIHEVMEEVHNHLEDKSLYVCDDLEFVEKHIENEGFTVIACNMASKIVGFSIFRYPGQNEDNLGRDIGLPDNQLEKVVHMESSAVLPESRGKGLQLSMLRYGEQLIDHSKYKYFMVTASPDNKWSYNTLEKNGYTNIITKEKYDGLKRRIYLKEI